MTAGDVLEKLLVATAHLDARLIMLGRVAICVAAGIVLACLLRNRAATERHTVWVGALLVSLVLVATTGPAAVRDSVAGWIWIAGTSLVALRTALGFALAGRLRRSALLVSSASWTALLQEGRERMGIRRPVALLWSDRVTTAITFGWHQCVILLPTAAADWEPDRRRVVLFHELAHAARHDWFIQLLERAAVALCWFHPLVLWASHRLKVEAERACDEAAIAAGVHRSVYTSQLLSLATIAPGHMVMGCAFTSRDGAVLEERIRGALEGTSRRGRWLVTIAAMSMLIAAFGASVLVSSPEQICPITGRALP